MVHKGSVEVKERPHPVIGSTLSSSNGFSDLDIKDVLSVCGDVVN